MEKEMTCIICPLGCSLKVLLSEQAEVLSITGNTCVRGANYAKTECTNPQRTLTTTLRCEDGSMIAVKTDRTIPKEKLLEAMKQINYTIVKLPVKVGDILVENVFGSNIVAVQNREI